MLIWNIGCHQSSVIENVLVKICVASGDSTSLSSLLKTFNEDKLFRLVDAGPEM